jgi:hypothetical protein
VKHFRDVYKDFIDIHYKWQNVYDYIIYRYIIVYDNKTLI